MLKIKDNINVEELKRFGFKPKYNEDTGKVTAYEKINKETEYEGLTVKIEKTKSVIRVFKSKESWVINKYKEFADLDTLYNLIQANLVEKVKE